FDRDDGATRRYDGGGTAQGSRRDHPAVFGTSSRLRGKTLGRRHYGVVCRCTGFGRVCNWIQEELASYNKISETPIRVRIGIHAGEPVEEGDDLFGSAVQMAARICGIAKADAILVSREVRDACAGVDLRFAPAGSETLKGFSEPVQLFSPAH